MTDSDSRIYRLAPRSRSRGAVITVSSGKGGTGKTNVCVNLAVALSERRRQVVVLDADIGLANVEVITGMKSSQTLQAVIEGTRSVSEILTVGPSGIKVVPGVSGIGHLAQLTREGQQNIRRAMDELQDRFEYVLIDTMAGIGPASVAFAVAADQVLLVTTPEPSALVDGYAMIKSVHALNPRASIHILVNMADDQAQALRTLNNLASTASTHLGMRLEYAGYLQRDRHVRDAALLSYPFTILYPTCPASNSIKELAANMLHEVYVAPKEPVPGFFRRFARTLRVAV